MPPSDQPRSGSSARAIQAPKGTRDLYPQDMLRKRYIEKAWRDTSIRHGFEEIDGPTFEYADLYAVKSGEGILNEVFGVFSGKDEEQRAGGGRAPYALRPEFTPTLARMYAAKAGSLPKPTKWFWQQNCFRAERPQRGRLREFGQWNVDLIGDDSVTADAEVLGCCIGMLEGVGLRPADVRVRISDRRAVSMMLRSFGLAPDREGEALELIDALPKLPTAARDQWAQRIGLSATVVNFFANPTGFYFDPSREPATEQSNLDQSGRAAMESLRPLFSELQGMGLADWCQYDLSVVRGLAYYTGMVFEVIAGGERAVAGGGRYDGLIELFGGPPTPAVGFGMGDVVLSLVLQDRGLMPEGKALLNKLSEPGASLRPDVFVISNGQPESDAQLRPLVARLRREGLHARHTYKATKNIGKLLQEAAGAHARTVAIIESGAAATLKNLDTGEQQTGVPLDELGARARAAS